MRATTVGSYFFTPGVTGASGIKELSVFYGPDCIFGKKNEQVK